MTQIRALLLCTDTPLKQSELSMFRGAIISAVPSHNILFHNHSGERLRYAYPLIQYKCIAGKAAIVCIGKGVEAIEELISEANFSVKLGKRNVTLRIDKIEAEVIDIQQSLSPISYRLQGWLPLNEGNYEQFMSTDGMVERIHILERILTGNVLSLLKGLNIFVDFQVQIVITDYVTKKPVIYKKVKFISVDLSFIANISLPEYIGIGKHSSIGAGILTRINKNNQ